MKETHTLKFVLEDSFKMPVRSFVFRAKVKLVFQAFLRSCVSSLVSSVASGHILIFKFFGWSDNLFHKNQIEADKTKSTLCEEKNPTVLKNHLRKVYSIYFFLFSNYWR